MNTQAEDHMDTQFLIDGEFTDGTETPEAILNPRTGETVLQLPEASLDQVDAAVSGARSAFAGWSRTTPRSRMSQPRRASMPKSV